MSGGGDYLLRLYNRIANRTFLSIGHSILTAGCSFTGEELFCMVYAELASTVVANGIVILVGVFLCRDIFGFGSTAVFAIPAFNTLACEGGFFRNVP
jgi:hypothetical protein